MTLTFEQDRLLLPRQTCRAAAWCCRFASKSCSNRGSWQDDRGINPFWLSSLISITTTLGVEPLLSLFSNFSSVLSLSYLKSKMNLMIKMQKAIHTKECKATPTTCCLHTMGKAYLNKKHLETLGSSKTTVSKQSNQ